MPHDTGVQMANVLSIVCFHFRPQVDFLSFRPGTTQFRRRWKVSRFTRIFSSMHTNTLKPERVRWAFPM